MKVLQLGKFYPILGGVEKVMWDLARGISARGEAGGDLYCDMLCARVPGEEVDESALVFNAHGRCISVKALRKVAATMISPAMVTWLRAHCREYDIIHVHHPDPMACLALWLSGFRGKVVLHWHSDILKQKTLLKFYAPLQNWLIRRADRIVGTTPVYVAQSPFLQKVQDKITYLPIGIDDDIRCGLDVPSECGDRVTVFSLGRLVGYKGYEYLVDAAKYLPDNYRIVIGGRGPLEPELRARIESAGLQDKVQLLGYLSDAEAHEWYRRCDVFALSSIWKTEAFAIVQIEAMSCGKPVVATHIPESGVDWVNADGISGLNVPVQDARAIADAVMDICSSRERYREFSAAARRRFEEMFTMDGMIDNCIKIYRSL